MVNNMNHLCMLCKGAIPSPIHERQCRHIPIDNMIAIANGNIRQMLRIQVYIESLKEQVTLFQGKGSILKHENNKLRKKLYVPNKRPENHETQFRKALVGKTLQQAEMLTSAEIRPVIINGKEDMLTLEYRPDRINVEIKDNIITKIMYIG